jgi:hypothetical protein
MMHQPLMQVISASPWESKARTWRRGRRLWWDETYYIHITDILNWSTMPLFRSGLAHELRFTDDDFLSIVIWYPLQVLTDDNFVSIVAAVEQGRVIYAGIQKFVAFIMSVHIGEVMQIFFCVVAGKKRGLI